MLFDNHSHTKFSSDSEMKVEEAVKAAEGLGIGLVLTEHLDYDYIFCKNYNGKDFRFEPREYWAEYAPYRGESLRLGVEIGLTDTSRDFNMEFIQKAPFDLVIGSIHMLDGSDLYYPDFYEGKTKEAAYGQYLRTMAEMLRKNPEIDVLGHIDYMCRYAPYEDKNIDISDFRAEIDDVLKAVLETDTVMELNTRRLGDAKAVKHLVSIYKRYKELGGKYITLGSDAHVAENIGMNFGVALEIAKEIELIPVTFAERKMK